MLCKSKHQISIFIFLLSLTILQPNCGGPGSEEPITDPTDVKIFINDDLMLEAEVIHNCVSYTQDDWPTEFGPPTFYWYQIDPKSYRIAEKKYQVTYTTIRRNLHGLHLWTFEPTDSEGVYYYRADVSFDQGIGNSATGVCMFKTSIMDDYTSTFIRIASGYIRVPYVYGVYPDANGDNCGKGIDRGYRGVDCSGLAWYAGYVGDETVQYTNCVDLLEDYEKDIPVDSLNLIVPPSADYEYLDGCMVLIDMDTINNISTEHVGLILNQDQDYYGEVIHATASQFVTQWLRYEHGRMTMREKLSDRTFWIDNFVDIGRIPIN